MTVDLERLRKHGEMEKLADVAVDRCEAAVRSLKYPTHDPKGINRGLDSILEAEECVRELLRLHGVEELVGS